MSLEPSGQGFMPLSALLVGEAPFAVRTIDIEDRAGSIRLPSSSSGRPYRKLLALVRIARRPLGWVSLAVDPDGRVSLGALDRLIERRSALDGCLGEGPAQGHASHSDALLSVVIATCAQSERTIRCVEAILAGDDGPLEVIVVENRPRGSTVGEALSKRFSGDPRVRYVEEFRPGLGQARNAGSRAASGDLIAFTDDDVTVDPAWAPALRARFSATPDVTCVTGLIAPLELETAAQVTLERFGNYGKGFVPRRFAIDSPPADQPLFPYTAGYFGSGANMAFRTQALRALGGFDPALGTGTPSRGCEDLDICIRLLQAGGELAYEPGALVWHRHPDTVGGLRQRAFDYGVALGALFGKHVAIGANRWDIITRIPTGVRYLTDPGSRKNAARGESFPPGLVRLERMGLLYGPVAYLASRMRPAR